MDYLFQILEEVKAFVSNTELSSEALEPLEQAFRIIISRSNVGDSQFNNLSFSQVAEEMANLIRAGQVDSSDNVVRATFTDIKKFLENWNHEHQMISSKAMTPVKTVIEPFCFSPIAPLALTPVKESAPAEVNITKELDMIESSVNSLFTDLCSKLSNFLQTETIKFPAEVNTDRRSVEAALSEPVSESFTISLGADAIVSCIKRLEDVFKSQNRSLKEKLCSVADDYFTLQQTFNESVKKDAESRTSVLQAIQSLLPLQHRVQMLVQDSRKRLNSEKNARQTAETRRQIAVRELKVLRDRLKSKDSIVAPANTTFSLNEELTKEWNDLIQKLPGEEAEFLSESSLNDRIKYSFLKLWETFSFEYTEQKERYSNLEKECAARDLKIQELQNHVSASDSIDKVSEALIQKLTEDVRVAKEESENLRATLIAQQNKAIDGSDSRSVARNQETQVEFVENEPPSVEKYKLAIEQMNHRVEELDNIVFKVQKENEKLQNEITEYQKKERDALNTTDSDRLIFSKKLTELEAELTHAKRKILSSSVLEESLNQWKESHAKLHLELSNLREMKKNSELQIAGLTEANSSKAKVIEGLEMQLSQMTSKLENASKELMEMTNVVSCQKQTIVDMMNNLVNIEKEKIDLLSKNADLEGKLANGDDSGSKVYEERLLELTKKMETLTESEKELRNQAANWESEKSGLLEKSKTLAAEVEESRQKLASHEDSVKSFVQEIQSLTAQVSESSSQIVKLIKESGEAKVSYSKLLKEKDSLIKENKVAQNEKKILMEGVKSKEAEVDELNARLEKMKSVQPVMGDLFKVLKKSSNSFGHLFEEIIKGRDEASPLTIEVYSNILSMIVDKFVSAKVQNVQEQIVEIVDVENMQIENVQTGNMQTGNAQTGNMQTGNAQSGNMQTGNAQSGNMQTGNAQSGNMQSGNMQYGNAQSGNMQYGNVQTGNMQSQSGNSSVANSPPPPPPPVVSFDKMKQVVNSTPVSAIKEKKDKTPVAQMMARSKSEVGAVSPSSGEAKKSLSSAKRSRQTKSFADITNLEGQKRKLDELESSSKQQFWDTPKRVYRTDREVMDNSDEENNSKVKTYGLMLTGFREGLANDFARRSVLVTKLLKIFTNCKIFDHYNDEVTHVVVADSDVATLKAQLGLVTGRWLMNVKWIEDSIAKGKFLDEDGYGTRRSAYPLKGRKIFFSQNFISHQHEMTLKSFEQIVEYAKGERTSNIQEADVILVHREDSICGAANPAAKVFTKDELIRFLTNKQ